MFDNAKYKKEIKLEDVALENFSVKILEIEKNFEIICSFSNQNLGYVQLLMTVFSV